MQEEVMGGGLLNGTYLPGVCQMVPEMSPTTALPIMYLQHAHSWAGPRWQM